MENEKKKQQIDRNVNENELQRAQNQKVISSIYFEKKQQNTLHDCYCINV